MSNRENLDYRQKSEMFRLLPQRKVRRNEDQYGEKKNSGK